MHRPDHRPTEQPAPPVERPRPVRPAGMQAMSPEQWAAVQSAIRRLKAAAR